jgi:hypothetical protein
MRPQRFAYLSAGALLLGSLAAIGCETRVHTRTTSPTPTTTEHVTTIQTDPPARPKTDVHVDVGNGRGVNVDVDNPRRPGKEVDVNVGGPRGVQVNVDKDGL